MTTNAHSDELAEALAYSPSRALIESVAAADPGAGMLAGIQAGMAREQDARLAAVTAVDGPRFAAHVGLDLSLTATGLAVFHAERLQSAAVLEKITTNPADYRSARDAKDRPVATYADRLNRLEDILARIESSVPPGSLVFLESPSYGSVGSGTFDRSGLWWLTYQRLTALSCRVVPVAPTQRMLYATGKGRADKDQVISAVVRRYPDLDVVDNNVADAVVLMAMAARAAGHPMDRGLPAGNMKAMEKLEAI